MSYTNAQVAVKVNTGQMVSFLALSTIAATLPFFIHLQWVTGPIVNAILILVLLLSGIRSAVVVALIPSMVALAGGLLPAILAPVVPFIMISNIIFVFTIDWLYSNTKSELKGFWMGVTAGAILKFLFLFFSVNIISSLLIKQELAAKVAQLMSWPQLATALLGGMIAWGVLKFLKRI